MIRLLNQQETFLYLVFFSKYYTGIFVVLLSTAVLTTRSMNFAAIIFAVPFNTTCGVETTQFALSHLFLRGLSTQHDDQLLVFNRSLCVFISEGEFWVLVATRLPVFHSSRAWVDLKTFRNGSEREKTKKRLSTNQLTPMPLKVSAATYSAGEKRKIYIHSILSGAFWLILSDCQGWEYQGMDRNI